MVRRVIFARPIADSDEMVGRADFQGAPFALLVEYLPAIERLWGAKRYRAKLHVRLRDADVLTLIDAHGLRDLVLYSDGEAAESSKRLGEVTEQMETGVRTWDARTVLVSMGRYGRERVVAARAVEITLGRLLQTVEIVGHSADAVNFVTFQVRSAIDQVAAKLATAASFEGEVRVFVPGEKLKPVKSKPGTPPSGWAT